MSHEYCILDLLNIKDKNIKLIDNFYKMEKIDNIDYKIIEAKLSYEPLYCSKCGCVFDENSTYEKNGFKRSGLGAYRRVQKVNCIITDSDYQIENS